ncbi:MAG: hypothetical protein M3005_05855 [Apilactobacillus sp.]|uniref:hypothetical protein n=1 Tax=Apilactobacillus TaxID=2767877 RepID=UPI0025E52F72|nr:hypothetical protein [Apilactobacillus sp.]MCT6823388.1 hypothetical protein [Apilactobacillus sp.]MCT6858172.1 hypothetical protein [Apilactobacillus sp.]
MHSGEAAEWVAAIAEALSVVVALFLPYYNQHVENKRKLRNIKMLIRRMSKRAMDGEEDALEHLGTILTTAYLKNMNSKTEDVINDGQQILDILKMSKGNPTEEQREKMRALLDEINSI